jgi:hypothetical protein
VTQVDHYDNLLVLCKNDHKMVDDDPVLFDVVRLRNIKADHYAWLSSQPDVVNGASQSGSVETEVDFDYIDEDSSALLIEAEKLRQELRAAEQEATRAESSPASLIAAACAARRVADSFRTRIQTVEEMIKRIDGGYPLWRRFGFESAVDACGEWCSWGNLGSITDGRLGEPSGDCEWRLPAKTQELLEVTVRASLFDSIILATTFDTPDAADDVAPGPFWHYLFGALERKEYDDSLFLIDTWVAENV